MTYIISIGDPMERYPKRKSLRLKDYDYSSNGMYFITICCMNRKNLLGNINLSQGGVLLHPQADYPVIELSNIGEIISEQWYALKTRYKTVSLDQFVVMPNHIHGIIIIHNERSEQSPAPTIGDILCAYKSISTKLSNKMDNVLGRIIWQRNYYEHIIRTEQELHEIREYILHNPGKWLEDTYFMI